MKDRPLDAGVFFTDPGIGFGGAGGFDPAAKDCVGPVEFLVGAETAMTSTERPRSARAIQRPRCPTPHERSAVAVLWPGSK
ncbi:MAG: hypothetical protein OXO56_14215 [Gammaproteobacteria bacterium]|nr:hypothetical protein [Gammaproteobacteria bacterium]